MQSVGTTSATLNIMKKYLGQIKEEIFYSEEEDNNVKQEQPQTPGQDSNALPANLKLESYGDLFFSQTKQAIDSPPAHRTRRQDNQDNDFYLPEAQISQSDLCDLSVDVSDSQIQKKKSNACNRKSGRKPRTAITKEKLQQMNRIFKEYHQNKNNGNLSQTSLKAIGDKLHLGYSTILHKYKEFKQNKRVKGGYLLQLQGSKRKYSKSVKVQSLIREALQKVEFANAVEISKYIFKTKEIYYSRAVICRHLLAMKRNEGEKSQNNLASDNLSQKETQPDEPTFEDLLRTVQQQGRLVYCHEIVFSTEQLPKDIKDYDELVRVKNKEKQALTMSLVFAISQNRLLYRTIKQGLLSRGQYAETICEIGRTINRQIGQNNQQIWLATSVNQIHYDLPEPQKKVHDFLEGLNIKKIILSTQDLRLEPLAELFELMKARIQGRPRDYEQIKSIILDELREWMSKQERFSF